MVRETIHQAGAAGVNAAILLGLADHESGLNPDVGAASLDPTGKHEQNAGAWQFTLDTVKGLGESVDAMRRGDIPTQVRAAIKLWNRNRAALGTDARAVLAWWVGPGGVKTLERGESIPNYYWKFITPAMGAGYVSNVLARAAGMQVIMAAAAGVAGLEGQGARAGVRFVAQRVARAIIDPSGWLPAAGLTAGAVRDLF